MPQGRKYVSSVRRAAALRELAELGCSQIRAAELMRVKRQLVFRICRKHKISMPPQIDKEKREEALRSMVSRGMPRRRIAERLGLTRSSVCRMLHEYGIDDSRTRGKRSQKTTLRRAAALREMADLGRSKTQAAILFGVDPSTVGYICKSFGIAMRDGRNRGANWLQQRIIRDYGKVPPGTMIERYNSTPGAVYASLSRLRKEGKLPPVQQRS